MLLKYCFKPALMGRIQMLRNHERCRKIRWKRTGQAFQRVNPAGRRADDDDDLFLCGDRLIHTPDTSHPSGKNH
jgi:hypothetical protein